MTNATISVGDLCGLLRYVLALADEEKDKKPKVGDLVECHQCGFVGKIETMMKPAASVDFCLRIPDLAVICTQCRSFDVSPAKRMT